MIQNEKYLVKFLRLVVAVKQSHDTVLYAANILMIIVEHTFWKFFTSNCNKLNKCL